ncbi:MAG: TetR/AcrR family transcriptional regulator [Cytophagales bacterium]|nr:TetR/AcrR family transcriptional regulator [Cytophagales bacterium]
MQVQKVNIKKDIIAVARKEFFDRGFKDASMRMIAKKAGVGLSNIYNYFRNKDEIFLEVLAPLMRALDKIMIEHNSQENLNIDIFNSEEYYFRHTNIYVDLIVTFNDELKLLLFQSYGSSLENFRDEYTDRHTKIGMEYLQKMKEKYPWIHVDISEFFIHTMSSWWISIIGEIVSHNLNTEEIKKFISEYMEFGTAGWKKIMKA